MVLELLAEGCLERSLANIGLRRGARPVDVARPEVGRPRPSYLVIIIWIEVGPSLVVLPLGVRRVPPPDVVLYELACVKIA